MLESPLVSKPMEAHDQSDNPPSEPMVMLVFGASGDMVKRLLVPALYNLECDGLLNEHFALLGTALDDFTSEQFRAKMNDDIKKYQTRDSFDQEKWDKLVSRFHYMPSKFDDLSAFAKLKEKVAALGNEHQTGGNVLFYLAVAQRFFGLICDNLNQANFKEGSGWRRIIVEKPFGSDLASALKLNKEVLAHWEENQIFRVDHYLGKETVQNLLAFRFSNGMFEPLWSKSHIDNIQFNVAEAVDVEGRGGYYDQAGVLRDMMENHMFQMLAYLCMEAPGSFQSDAIRNEKAKLLQAVRIYAQENVSKYAVRGQYGPELDDAGKVLKPGYRQEKDVNPQSKTETYAALRLHIDNWRWEGVPIYLRSGKALWKRGTEIVVEFRKAPLGQFRGTHVHSLSANRLIFHIQPYQGIEVQFQAKVPGPTLQLQPVHMRFGYGDAFKTSRYNGYEVMLYSCSHGDATLFSRGDLVEAAWRIAQPILDYWKATPAPEFPNYARGSWGPKAAADLIERDHRHWREVITEEVLSKVAFFKNCDPLFLSQAALSLHSRQAEAGQIIIKKDTIGREMYIIARGEVEVLDDAGQTIKVLSDGDVMGEIALLLSSRRTATIRAKTSCDLYALGKDDFHRILREHPQFAEGVAKVAEERYNVIFSPHPA